MIRSVLTAIILSIPLIGAYALFSIGIVLIFQTSRILNLAHGAMAMIPAFILAAMSGWGLPVLLAAPLAIATGGLLGVAVERIFVRRLEDGGPTGQTVGTVAALGVLVALAARIWGTTPRTGTKLFPEGFVSVGSSSLQFAEIGLFVVSVGVAAGLFIALKRTDIGLMMRGTAESKLAARLHGVDPDLVTTGSWAVGGALAALSGILLGAVTGLQPYTLSLQVLPGFIAALLGGLRSLPLAIAGAAFVGITQSLVPLMGPIGRSQGSSQLFLAVAAIAVMALRGSAIAGSER
jgi:branched-chain amino acid transport system permease protein